jgi:putative ABC transport system permease protein
MELHARWAKILKDIWGNKARSLLVIFSIAVGVAAVGMINNAGRIAKRDLYGTYRAGNPAHLYVYVSPFEDELASAVEGMREVESAQSRRTADASVYSNYGEWEDITLNVLPDYEDVKVNQYTLEQGTSTPRVREIILERKSAKGLGLELGDTITVEMENERRYALTVTGIIHDMYIMPYNITDQATGYVTMETLEWMGETPYFNRLDIIVSENKSGSDHVLAVGELIRDRTVESAGYVVGRMEIPGVGSAPGEHWAQNQIKGFLLILQVMGILAIFLSGGLIVNTISAILVQQVKQIGIMRSVGAVRKQIIEMYITNVVVFSLLGLLFAIPVGLLGAWGLVALAGDVLNFDVTRVDLAWQIVLLQAATGLIMPIGVALFPIIAGTRISVYDAIYQYGLSGEGKRGPIEKLLVKIRNLSPPVMLSLRNTFRNKARLAFTLVTLTLAGAMFVSVFSTRASLTRHINEIERYIDYDASLRVPGGANIRTVEREALRIPGVTVAEGWSSASGVLLHADGSESEDIELVGLPYDSVTIDPKLLGGRWLQPEDTTQVVINEDLLEDEPDIAVGSEITVEVDDKERTFEVVGIVSKHLSGARIYMNYGAFARLTDRPNEASVVRVRASAEALSSPAQQDKIAELLEERFDNAGLSSENAQTSHAIFSNFTSVFNIILIVLVIMATLLAVVGGLGLTGTMGINVLERTREIGVLRAVGASTDAVRKVVVVEGITVGLMSWILAAILSAPTGLALAGAVVQAVFETELSYQYSYIGLGIWLAIVSLIGVASSLAPARSAAQLTVREVLDYE